MRFRPRIFRRTRFVLTQIGLLAAVLWTGVLTHRQSRLLPEATAAPRRTPEVERAPAPTPPGPTPTPGLAVLAPIVERAAIIDHARFFYAPDFYPPQIQAFLDGHPGPLKGYRAMVGSREHSFAEILVSQTSLYSLNPQVVLALIEQQSGLITSPDESPERLDWALNYRGEDEHWIGFLPQLRWAIRELHRAQRDYPAQPQLTYADASHSPMPAGLNVGGYAVARVLAATTTPEGLQAKLSGPPDSFVATFTRLFGDPRQPTTAQVAPAAPFLSLPLDRPYPITSFFDHDTPFLAESGSIVTYRGDESPTLSYDGHDGWDYAAMPPVPVLAAADGTVVFAGHSDDGCGVAIVVIIDHGNGYRTLYWHLDEVLVEPGPVKRGTQIGVVGASGCVTGPHLHFQVQFLGRDTDPYGWCGPSGNDPWANHAAGAASTWLWASMPSPCALPSNVIVVDPGDPGWRALGSGWETLAGGASGSALRASSTKESQSDMPVASWTPSIKRAGRYRVLTWVPYIENGVMDTKAARYLIHHAGGQAEVVVDQAALANNWVDLGTYDWDASGRNYVGLAAVDEEPGSNVWYDAMLWLPAE